MSGNLPDILRAAFRETVIALGLGILVFVAARYCIGLFPQGPGGIAGLWLVNGLPLAALLRTPGRQWPALMIAAFVGNVAAAHHGAGDSLSVATLHAAINALQIWLCAHVLRRRFGTYFDLTRTSHLAWLAGIGGITALFHVAAMLSIALLVQPDMAWAPQDLLSSFVATYVGLFILVLPVLAITTPLAWRAAHFDRTALALLILLIALVVTSFGTPVFPGIYAILPVLMMLGWRHGLPGGGIGSLVVIVLAVMSSLHGTGVVRKLDVGGYGEIARGFYLELFFATVIFISLLPAIVRARQRTTELALAEVLEASENRASLLARSEALALEAKERLRTMTHPLFGSAIGLDGNLLRHRPRSGPTGPRRPSGRGHPRSGHPPWRSTGPRSRRAAGGGR